MTYRVYSGPRGAKMPSAFEKERMLYKEFETLDGAFGWARHINNEADRVALLIEGDDGTRLDKERIVTALRSPEEPARTGFP